MYVTRLIQKFVFDMTYALVSFAKYRLFCRALLQKRPIILRSLLIVATPYGMPPRHKSLLQNIVSFLGLFCKIDLKIRT